MNPAELHLTVWSSLLAVAALLAAGVWISKLRGEARRAAARIRSLESLASADRAPSRAEREHEFFVKFAREFPHMTQALGSDVDAREIPQALKRILVRTFEPRQAIVLLRRRSVATEENRDRTLVVAAVEREEGAVAIGQKVSIEKGDIGLAAKTHQVVSRDDIAQLAPHVRSQITNQSPPGFSSDLIAPMVFRNETVGALVLSRPNLRTEGAKAVIRVIAHMGALALHHATTFNEMKVTAEIDGLTGLYNKSHITVLLAEKVVEAEARGESLSVLLIDIDHFKSYNDTNGHDAGDRLLSAFAQLISDNVRERDALGRFGGEEFLLVLPGTNAAQAMAAAEKIRSIVAGHNFPYAERQPLGVLSFSGGVATYPRDGDGSASLVRAADKALYEAKRSGRNRVLQAEERSLGEPSGQLLEHEHELASEQD